MWKLTNWPIDVIRRQSVHDLKVLTESTEAIDWHPPSLDDLGDLREGG